MQFSFARLSPRLLITGMSLLILGFQAGCANYHLGVESAPLEFHSIYLAPVTNPVAAPQIVAPVSRALRNRFVADGRTTLANSPHGADRLLSVKLVSYTRDFTAVLPSDTALARKFDVTLVAHCTLTDQRSGKVLFTDREIKSTRQIFVDGGQNPAEYQVVPQLAEDLAERISHAVLDVW
jgi:hypothetical protein